MHALLKPITPCLLAIMIACSKSNPDQVKRFNSPNGGIFYTVETYYGHGAIDNDYTRVYLHLERKGRSEKVVVLSGTYVNVKRIDWLNPKENRIYIDGGFTDTFRNQVTIFVGGGSETFHAYLQEDQPAGQSK